MVIIVSTTGDDGVLQANPVAKERDGKVSSDTDDEEEALVPLDSHGTTLKLLERGAYGPCASRLQATFSRSSA